MITKELLDYITYQLDHGESWEGTRGDLSSSGWAINVLDEAYLQVMTKKKEAAMAQLPNPLVEVASESGNTSVSPEQVKNSNPEKTLIKSPLTPTESGISVPGVRKQEQPKGKGKLIGLISIIVVVLVLIGGSAFAYFNYIYSDNVLARIFVNSQNLESGEFSGKIKFEYTPSEKTKEEILAEIPIEVNKMKGEFDLSGRYNFKNKENVKMDVIVKANSKSENDASYGIDSEWKIIDNAIYGKVNNLVAPQELDQYVASAKLIALSRWIKLYASGQDEESISVKLINARKEIQKNSNEINKNLIKAVSLQFQGFENNDNILCSKFKVVFDKQKTRELFIVLAKEKNLSEDEINETLVAYDKVYEDLIKNINANISVGVFDSLIHNASIVFTGPLEGGMSTIDINVSSKKENSDIKVDDIADFTEIEKIFEDMSSAIVAISQEIDDSIKSAMQQAKDIAESYKALKGTYINFDTSIDGEKIIKENINSWGGNAVTIFTTKEKYCLSKDLINALGTSWCLDSSSFLGNGTCDKEKITCIGTSTSVTPTPVINPTNPTNNPIAPIVVPTAEKSETQNLIDSLSLALQAHNTQKGTYLGYISSANGIAAVKKINEQEGDALIVATSKAKFCLMKKVNVEPTYYCVDSTGYSGKANGCSSKNISCE